MANEYTLGGDRATVRGEQNADINRSGMEQYISDSLEVLGDQLRSTDLSPGNLAEILQEMHKIHKFQNEQIEEVRQNPNGTEAKKFDKGASEILRRNLRQKVEDLLKKVSTKYTEMNSDYMRAYQKTGEADPGLTAKIEEYRQISEKLSDFADILKSLT